MHYFRLLSGLLAAVLIPCLLACAPNTTEETTPDAGAAESAGADSASAETGTGDVGACADEPYVERKDAAKDAFTSTTNFLRCDEGKYALCYYSGAFPLPCTPGEDGDTGDCQCQVFEATPEAPMYVEIGGILNKCIYDESVDHCKEDGSGCRNMCLDKPEAPGCENSVPDARQAPACAYIAAGDFNPDAEFISTFSFAAVNVPGTDKTFSLGSNSEKGRYAGCMTAPCTGLTVEKEAGDGHAQQAYTTCACPLWPREEGEEARYQFGRQCTEGERDPKSPGYCELQGEQMWSAAVNDMLIHAFIEHVASGEGADAE